MQIYSCRVLHLHLHSTVLKSLPVRKTPVRKSWQDQKIKAFPRLQVWIPPSFSPWLMSETCTLQLLHQQLLVANAQRMPHHNPSTKPSLLAPIIPIIKMQPFIHLKGPSYQLCSLWHFHSGNRCSSPVCGKYIGYRRKRHCSY